MGSIFAKSLIQKNRPAVVSATGLYFNLNSSISFSVLSAISYFLAISLEIIFEFDRISIAFESPNISYVLERVYNI